MGLTDKLRNDIDELDSQLMRPVYILRMARAQEFKSGPIGLGARKRADSARKEIHEIVIRYGLAHS